MSRFEIRDEFYLDGKALKIISGSIHYFRVPREYWHDRLCKLKALGCNCVETYVPWNLHEPKPGQFDFSGNLDIAAFLRQAQDLGLLAIVRPSPYICAEWEFGGLPAWLLCEDDMVVRSFHPKYLAAVQRYYDALLPVLLPCQIDRGGNVLMMQVENEFGSYGKDKKYLTALADMMRSGGISVPLFTSDGPWGDLLHCGTIDGVFPTANFGSHSDIQFDILEKFHGEKRPLMCMEYWIGWFDHWGAEHHVTDADASAQDLDRILARGSVNIYMFHGGTSFGLMNGSNYVDHLTPDITSYDYDALLTEDGRITEKYKKFQQVIAKYTTIPSDPLPPAPPRAAYGKWPVTASAPLFPNVEALSAGVESPYPLPMEKLGQDYGYTLYRVALDQIHDAGTFQLTHAADRANVYLDGRHLATLYDRELDNPCEPAGRIFGKQMDILMENMGRVNYGVMLDDQHKGIAGKILMDNIRQDRITMFPLPMDTAQLEKIPFGKPEQHSQPAFYRVDFRVEEAADTYLELPGFGKGVVALNGRLLGRFWEIGPQKRLYIPAPWLNQGENTLVIFESEGKASGAVEFFEDPAWTR